MSTEKNNIDQNIPTWTSVHQKVLNDVLQNFPRTDNEIDYNFLITICRKWRSSFRDQSFTSLMADLRQDINRVSSFLNGTFL